MEQTPTSPTPAPVAQEEQFDFYEAIRRAVAGKKVHKLAWSDRKWYADFVGTLLKIHKPDNTVHDWIISIEDTQGTDWIELSD